MRPPKHSKVKFNKRVMKFMLEIPSSDREKSRGGPLPTMELLPYMNPVQRSEVAIAGGYSAVDADFPNCGTSLRRSGRVAVNRSLDAPNSYEESPVSSVDSNTRRKRVYKQKTDAEKQSLAYKQERARNREAVDRTREKKKAEQEEKERKNEEEKQMMIGTIKKMLEAQEWNSIVVGKQLEGLFIPTEALSSANFGVMNAEQRNFYERMRTEVRMELETRVMQLARRSGC